MGEPAVVAGEITRTTSARWPVSRELRPSPGLNWAASDNTRTKEEDELLIVITGARCSPPESIHGLKIWISEKSGCQASGCGLPALQNYSVQLPRSVKKR